MSVIARLLAPPERLTAALCDSVRREHTVHAVLVGFVAIWTLYGVLAKGSQGLHFDMTELADQSRHLEFGYAKNPPFPMWLAAAWFAVFPRTEWAFYLLAMTSIAVALGAAWRLYGRLLNAEKRVLALALLALVPLLTFHALKLNNNVLMIPLWALTALWFVRSYDGHGIGAAALAGLFAALAMLTKYWSIFLIAGLALAALADRRRAGYFRSPAPWISAAVGALVLAPHLAWLYQHDFPSFSYALTVHGGVGFGRALKSVLGYLAATAAYAAIPIAVALIALRPPRVALRDMRPKNADGRLVTVLFLTALLLPIAVALITKSKISALWTMGIWTWLPVLLLSPPALEVTRAAAARVVALAIALPFVATLAAPGIAYAIQRADTANPTAYYKPLAVALERQWRQLTARPLRIVGGEANLAYGVAFYTRDGAMALPNLNRWAAPWIDNAMLAREGLALVCPVGNRGCIELIECYVGTPIRDAPLLSAVCKNFIKGYTGVVLRFQLSEVALTARYLGLFGATRRFVIMIVPPQKALADAPDG